jgi:hypothetical protein
MIGNEGTLGLLLALGSIGCISFGISHGTRELAIHPGPIMIS